MQWLYRRMSAASIGVDNEMSWLVLFLVVDSSYKTLLKHKILLFIVLTTRYASTVFLTRDVTSQVYHREYVMRFFGMSNLLT